MLQTPDGFVSAFGTEVLKTLTGGKTYIIKSTTAGIEEITVQGIPPVKTDTLGRKWISWVKTPETDLDSMEVFGKFVFVGVTANGVMPQIATPVGLLEPHKIQAALSESLLIQDSPYIPAWSMLAELSILIVSVLLVWFVLQYAGIYLGLFVTGNIFLGTAISGFFLIQSGLLLDVTWTLISQFVTGSLAFYTRFREQYKLRLQIKKQFEHYLDPGMVKKLQKDPSLLKLGGETRNMTFLFCDIRGFTPISEKYKGNPAGLTKLINRFLTRMTDVIIANGGTIDKFIGDAIMVFFGDPETEGEVQDALKCIEMAILMRQRVEELQKHWKKMGVTNGLGIRMGISTGFCTVGNFGSDLRLDYTVLGSPVNLAARLQSAAERNGILIDENTNNLINDVVQTEKNNTITPKGFVRPIDTFILKDFKSQSHKDKRKMLSHSGKRIEINVIDSSDIRAAIEELKNIQEKFEKEYSGDEK